MSNGDWRSDVLFFPHLWTLLGFPETNYSTSCFSLLLSSGRSRAGTLRTGKSGWYWKSSKSDSICGSDPRPWARVTASWVQVCSQAGHRIMGWSHVHGCGDHGHGINYCTELFLQVKPVTVLNVCMLSHSGMSHSLRPHGLTPTRLLSLWDYPGKNTVLLLLLSRFSRVQLCDPIDGSPPGSPVPGILQARTLEWVAISFSSAWKWTVTVKSLRHVWLLATSWTVAYQAPPSMGFSRQEYWSGVPLPSPRIL